MTGKRKGELGKMSNQPKWKLKKKSKKATTGNSMKCPNCGEYGSHLVPASLGDSSFFICEAVDPVDKHITALHLQRRLNDGAGI